MMQFTSGASMAIFYTQPVIVLMVSLSALVGVTLGLSKNGQMPLDLFALYADILPGHMAASIKVSKFTCDSINTAPQQNFRICRFKPESGPFSLITVTFSPVNVIKHTAFTLPESLFQTGDLVSLWGRPQIKVIGEIAYLSWPDRCATAWAKSNKRHYRHWLPVWYVVFDCN